MIVLYAEIPSLETRHNFHKRIEIYAVHIDAECENIAGTAGL